MVDKSCDGYSNWATYCVAVWLDADLGRLEESVRVARDNHFPGDLDLTDAAAALEAWVSGQSPELEGLWADLLIVCLHEVDWYQIALSRLVE